MAGRKIYGSELRDSTINEHSFREFTKSDCMTWLDSLEDESVNLWILDAPYNVLKGNMTNKNGAALFHSRYTAKITPTEADLKSERVSSKFEIAIPWEEQRKLEDYKSWCEKWYVKAHKKLCEDSFMFIFWSMRYLYLAYEIFDVNRVVFWQQPNMVSSISGDFSYDITPIIIVRKGNARLNKDAKLWDKSSILNFTKPQSNYIDDKLLHPCFVAGTKVFVNNNWENIETIKIGDVTPYGEVQEVMVSKSNNIYELITELGITKVTGNHPVLIINKEGIIQWKQVQSLTESDLLLQRQDITEVTKSLENLCTFSFGNIITDQNQKDMMFTILTELKPIIELKISNLSNTDYTANVIVNKQEDVKKDIKYVINVKENYHSQMNIGIKDEDISKDLAKIVYCKPVKIVSLKREETHKDENIDVYNLSIKNNNFYDVENIGIVHNCQKPKKLLEHLVWLSDTDHDDYVIGDFFAGSGSLLRAVNKADVILCDMNDEYFDKFFDINISDKRVNRCKKK